jgi:branched-chain amino acid transport system permease protein
MLLFMLASGLTLILSLMGILNFAHSSFYMLGAYLGFECSRRLGFWPGLLIAPLGTGVAGAVLARFGLMRANRLGEGADLLFTIGLAFVIGEMVQMVWGKSPVDYRVPASLRFVAFTVFDTEYPAYRLFMLLSSIVLFVALLVIMKKTRLGLLVQACVSNPTTVATLGHNVPLIQMLMFGFGCALAGFAGAIAGPALVTEPYMADQLGPVLFVVVIVGGLGSLGGALASSLLFGLLQTFTVAFDISLEKIFGPTQSMWLQQIWTVSGARIAPMTPYLLLILVLTVRPQGLMGNRQ